MWEELFECEERVEFEVDQSGARVADHELAVGLTGESSEADWEGDMADLIHELVG